VTPYADGDYYGFADRDGVSPRLSVEAGHDHEGEHDHEHVGRAYLYVADADALYASGLGPAWAGRPTLSAIRPTSCARARTSDCAAPRRPAKAAAKRPRAAGPPG
jgi:hypothetical protein